MNLSTLSSSFAVALPLWCRVLVLVLLLTGCQGGSQPPVSPGLVMSQAWRMDVTGQETLQTAQAASDWQTLPDWNSWGFGRGTVWVRLQLRAAPATAREPGTPTPWVVRVRPAFLDYVTLHDPATGLVLHSGDAVPPVGEDLSSIHFRFQIPALPQSRVVYLQMRSTSARTLHVQVQPYGQDLQSNRLQEWAMGFVMASSAIFAVWAFLQWTVSREKVIGAFALKQLFAAGWAFFFLGFARVSIGPGLPEGLLSTLSTLVFIGVISVTLWFFSLLIEGYQPVPGALRAIRVMALLVLALPLLLALGQPHLIVKLGNISVLLGFVLLLSALLSAVPRRVQQPIPLAVFVAYMTVYSTLNALPSLIHLGWIPAHPMVLYGGFAHAVLDGFVMFVLLQIRARSLRQTQLQAALQLQRSMQQAEDEKRHRQEQSQLFAMLAHEMKTPLATLRMWMEAGQLKPETMERAIADMNAVIERCVHTGQLADQGLQPDWQALDPLALTRACCDSARESDQVDLHMPANADLIVADAQMLSIVLGNLLDNACKYSASGSRVTLRLQAQRELGRDGWCWQVSNWPGPAGLPDPDRLFQKYYRSPQARRLSGSGLGLFLVKGLLELMQGQIHYAVHEGEAVFRVWLPQGPDVALSSPVVAGF